MSEPVYQRLAPATEIAENSMRAYALGERSILVCRTKAGLHALDNICSHGYAKLDEGRLRGVRVICPLHGASFDCRDGSVLGAPATAPLQSYPVRTVDGWIEVEVPGP